MIAGLKYLLARNRGLFLVLILFWVVALFSVKIPHHKNGNWYGVIQSDAVGYYVSLPTLILHQDANYDYLFDPSINEKYGQNFTHAIKQTPEGRRYTKYYYGTSLMQLPFFLGGAILAKVAGYPVDGFSPPFQWSIMLAALFYSLLGVYFLRLWLRQMDLSEGLTRLTVVGVYLGTCLFNYVFNESGFSHAYAFFTVSAFLHFQTRWFNKGQWKNLALAGLFIGLTVVIRPTSGIVLMVLPLLAGSWSKLFQGIGSIFRSPWGWLCLLIPLVLLGGQSLWYYWQTGSWWLWAYEGEGFDFSNPKWGPLLFGFRKGLFVYSPLLLLIIPGMARLWKNSPRSGLSMVLFFGLNSWILSSWWCWWYGGSFGMRAFIDAFPVLALPLALGLQALWQSFGRWAAIAVVLAGIGLNLIQNYQYVLNIIHYSEMNDTKYWQVFLKTDGRYRWATFDPPQYLRNKVIDSVKCFYTDYNHPTPHFENQQPEHWEPTSPHQIRKISCKVDKTSNYGGKFQIPTDSIRDNRYTLVVEIAFDVLYTETNFDAVAVLGTQKEEGGRWMAQKLVNSAREQNVWQGAKFEFLVKQIEDGEESLYFFLLNESSDPIWIDQLRVNFYYLRN